MAEPAPASAACMAAHRAASSDAILASPAHPWPAQLLTLHSSLAMRSLQAGETGTASGKPSGFFSTFSKVASRRAPLQRRSTGGAWVGMAGSRGRHSRIAAGTQWSMVGWCRGRSELPASRTCNLRGVPEGRGAVQQLVNQDAKGPPVHQGGVAGACQWGWGRRQRAQRQEVHGSSRRV